MGSENGEIVKKFKAEVYSMPEQEKLSQFREKLSVLDLTEEQNTDAYLIRWLRARSMNVDKAFDMLKTSLEWRKANNVDGILSREELPEDYKNQVPWAYLGEDKDGYPILVVPIGAQDMKGLLEKYGQEKCMRFHVILCETICEFTRKVSKEQGRPIWQIVEIIDFDGFNYRQMLSQKTREIMQKTQMQMDANYPEVLRYAMFINTPKIFYYIFNMMKPFVSKQTLEKLDIYGQDKDKWSKVVAEKFPIELVPKRWGGTREGSDEFCSKDDIWVQGRIDPSYYLGDQEGTTIVVNARDTFKINLKVEKPNSLIKYKVSVQAHDVGFKITCGDEEVATYTRVQRKAFEGEVKCEKIGEYTVSFDNSYSYMRSKSVSYKVSVEVEECKEDEIIVEST